MCFDKYSLQEILQDAFKRWVFLINFSMRTQKMIDHYNSYYNIYHYYILYIIYYILYVIYHILYIVYHILIYNLKMCLLLKVEKNSF